jgi:hypothetical protein
MGANKITETAVCRFAGMPGILVNSAIPRGGLRAARIECKRAVPTRKCGADPTGYRFAAAMPQTASTDDSLQ